MNNTLHKQAGLTGRMQKPRTLVILSEYIYYFTARMEQTYLLLDVLRFQCIKNDLIRSLLSGLTHSQVQTRPIKLLFKRP